MCVKYSSVLHIQYKIIEESSITKTSFSKLLDQKNYQYVRFATPHLFLPTSIINLHAHHFIINKAFKQDICTHQMACVDLSTTDLSTLSRASSPFPFSFW